MSFPVYKAVLAASTVLTSAVFNTPAMAEESDDPLTDIIVVTGSAGPVETDVIRPEEQPMAAPDAASLVARAPGAALVDNGALSGQVQYRGSFGDRILVRINGQRFGSGGPNWMDPPLHYAPMVLVDHIELDRGISPVSTGPGEAGGANAILKKVDFSDSVTVSPSIDVSGLFRSADTSYALGGVAGIASDRWRLGLLASREDGDDYQFRDGQVVPTSFERNTYGIHAGFRTGPGEISVEYRRNETKPTGNPPFPMDIIYVNTDFLRMGVKLELAQDIQLEGNLGQVQIAHKMDNNSLRPDPAPMRMRAIFADTDTTTADLAVHFDGVAGRLSIGGDIELGDRQVRITNPANAAFFIASLNRVDTDRLGGFAEWRGALGPIEAQLGARIDHHSMSAEAPLLGSAVPMGPRMLAMAFTNADRDLSDTTYDLAIRLWVERGGLRPRLTLARKTRAPSPLERFSWLPTPASAGQADGNVYAGNLALDPETMWMAEAGVDIETGQFYLRPTVFYRRVDDYVQGTPFDDTPGVIDSPVEMVAAMNGDPTPLQWKNVKAELYGADIDFGAHISGPFRVDGVASYVRGKRRDIDDNLYRIAPPSIRFGLTAEGTVLNGRYGSVTAELHAVAKQHKVSLTNSEQETGGFVLGNLYGGLDLLDGVRLDVGVENLFDRHYREHLAGYNQVAAGDVPVGERLPGIGRSGYLRMRIRY